MRFAVEHRADLRFEGQEHTVTVELDPSWGPDDVEAIRVELRHPSPPALRTRRRRRARGARDRSAVGASCPGSSLVGLGGRSRRRGAPRRRALRCSSERRVGTVTTRDLRPGRARDRPDGGRPRDHRGVDLHHRGATGVERSHGARGKRRPDATVHDRDHRRPDRHGGDPRRPRRRGPRDEPNAGPNGAQPAPLRGAGLRSRDRRGRRPSLGGGAGDRGVHQRALGHRSARASRSMVSMASGRATP